MLDRNIELRNAHLLGLDDHDGDAHVVCRASAVLSHLKAPYSEGWDKHYRFSEYTETKKMLVELGDAMVEIYACGMSTGSYNIRPLLVSPSEWKILQGIRCAS